MTIAGCAIASPPAADAASRKKAPAAARKPALAAKPAAVAKEIVPPAPPLAKPIGKPGDWFPIESYPAEAKVAGQEGRTVFALDIDARGRITGCHITVSSGSDLLDSTTCSQLIANGRFEPARDAQGKPIAGQWRSAMRWQLQSGPSSEPDQR